MSEDSEKHRNDEELEALLRQLVPTPLNVDLIAELNRDRERLPAPEWQSPSVIQWRRVIPLTLVSALVMFGFGFLQYGDALSKSPAAEVAHSAPAEIPAVKEESLVPVSAHGFLLNASSGGVVQTEEGPRQRMSLEYQDAYHWHDPESGTNFRFFQPRSEEVIVPLQTD